MKHTFGAVPGRLLLPVVVGLVGLAQLAACKCVVAQTPNTWFPLTTIQSPDDATHLWWVDHTYSAAKVFLGDKAQIWDLSSADAETAKGSTFTKGSGWDIANVQYASDGSLRSPLIKPGTTSAGGVFSGDSLQVWSLTSGGVKTTNGPVYTKGAGWHSGSAGVMPDDTLRALWIKPGVYSSSGVYSGDTVEVWTLDTAGTKISAGPSASKGKGWYFTGFALASDGTFRVLWTQFSTSPTSAGKAAVWTVDTGGSVTSKGPVLSKGAGWTPIGFGIASDDTLRLQWESTNYTTDIYSISVWALDTGGTQTSEGPNYAGTDQWFPGEFVVSPDGTSHTLWESSASTDEAVSLWSFDAVGTQTLTGITYSKGGEWAATNIKVDSDGSMQLIWNLPPAKSTATSSKGTVWTLDETGTETVEGPDYSF